MAKATPIRDKLGQYAGSISHGGTVPPTPNPVGKREPLFEVAPEEKVGEGVPAQRPRGEMLALKPGATVTQTAAAKGEDAPSRAISCKGGMRLYVLDPADDKWAVANPSAAEEQGRAVPSVTTVMKMMPKPQLTFWMLNQGAACGTRYVEEMRGFLDRGDVAGLTGRVDELLARAPGDYKGRSVAEKSIATAYKQPREDAADRGTGVHAKIEALLRGDDITIEEGEEGFLRSYHQFRADYPEMEVVATEVTVVNTEHGYAGTADAIVRIGDDHYVVDWKTNKDGAVYDQVGAQLAALAHAPEVLHPDGSRSGMPPIKGGLGVGLGPNGQYNVRAFNVSQQFGAFLGCLHLRNAERSLRASGSGKVRSVDDIRRFGGR